MASAARSIQEVSKTDQLADDDVDSALAAYVALAVSVSRSFGGRVGSPESLRKACATTGGSMLVLSAALIPISYFADAKALSKLSNVLTIYFFHFVAVDIAYTLVSTAWRAPKCRLAPSAEYVATFIGVFAATIGCVLVYFSLLTLSASVGIGFAAGAVAVLFASEAAYWIVRFQRSRRGTYFLWLTRHAFYFSLLIQAMLITIPGRPLAR